MDPYPSFAMKIKWSEDFFEAARRYLRTGVSAILVTIDKTRGSTPRDTDARMLITTNETIGTVGGGQLEWIVSIKARDLISSGKEKLMETIYLGPEIGQCCGGSVSLSFQRLTETTVEMLSHTTSPLRPKVQIHGAGHTGKALVRALDLLPFDTVIIDSRKEALANINDSTQAVLSAMPEAQVRTADPNTAFVVFTHQHDLDFLIAAEALNRQDAAYVGMIGSKTKRAVFEKWLTSNDYRQVNSANLTCPIGASDIKDKRPEIIAALVAGELIRVFAEKT